MAARSPTAELDKSRPSTLISANPQALAHDPDAFFRDGQDLGAALRYVARHPNELSSYLSPADIVAFGLGFRTLGSGVDAVTLATTAAAESHIAGNAPAALVGAEAAVSLNRIAEGAPNPNTSNTFGLDVSKLKIAQLGVTLWVMFVVAALGVVAFELVHRRTAETDLSAPIGYGTEPHVKNLFRIFAGVRPLVTPYLFETGTLCPWYFLSALFVLGLWELAGGLMFTVWMKDFWDIIEHKDREMFFPIMRDFALLVSTLIMVGTYNTYISMMLIIHWRKFMTNWLLGKWLHAKAFYQLQLESTDATCDNPDQRIQEDIQGFIQSLLALVSGFLSTLGRSVSMLPLLLVLSPKYAFGVFYCPGWLLYLSLAYSGFGTLAVHCIGGKLILLNFSKQMYEADFRYHIVQVRDNAESIALYGSEPCEQTRLGTLFDNVVRVWWSLMTYTKRLSFFTAFYGQTSNTFPYLLLAPSYLKGEITLGTMFMLFQAIASVKGGFDWVISSYTILTDFRATVDRLHNFVVALEIRAKTCEVTRLADPPPPSPESALVAKDLSIRLPDTAGARVIWEKAGLCVRRGEFVLLTAPEGSGKSCFFRALARIWPHASGEVYMPENTLFIPQRSYIPQGSLKQALAYPGNADRFTDHQVNSALEAVGLPALHGRKLTEESNWQVSLSGGEQQRLAIAHAVLMRPFVLLMDEATSAMGTDGALEMYQLLRQPGILPEGAAVVSISHHVNLLSSVHDTIYQYCSDTARWLPCNATC